MKRRSFLTGLLAAPAAPVVAKVFVQAKEAASVTPAVTPESPFYRFGHSTVEVIDGTWVTACASRSVPMLDCWDSSGDFDDEYDNDQ